MYRRESNFKLRNLKYTYRPDIDDRAALEQNFREKFEALNHVRLTDSEFQRLLDELITPDVFTAARVLRERNDFTRDDGTPLAYTLVNIRDWCKNDFEVVHQFRINTDYSHHRYDVILLINGVPVVQVELKTLSVNPRRAMEQIVEYKNDVGNGYIWHTTGSGKTLTSFKASTLLKENVKIDKCVFVVDRKDLDRQTREEFNRFHVDYYKPEGKDVPKAGQLLEKRAIVEAMLAKHDAATYNRRFNALFATASINDAIEYYGLFQTVRNEKGTEDPNFVPLKIGCVFSPPAERATSSPA